MTKCIKKFPNSYKKTGYSDREIVHITNKILPNKDNDDECELFLEFTGLVKVIGFRQLIRPLIGMASLRIQTKT